MKKNEQSESSVKIRKGVWLYSILSASVLLFAAIIVLIVLALNGVFSNSPTLDNSGNPSTDGGSVDEGNTDNTGGNNTDSGSSDGSNGDGTGGGDVNTGVTVSFVNPLDNMTVVTEQGFFYNSTLNCYYEHAGIDVSAEAGSSVYAVCGGVIESINSGDMLSGTQITLVKEDGTKVVYGYVDPLESLKVGDAVTQGQVIGSVSNPTGSEYKTGAHLHLEMYTQGNLADPAKYFTFAEK